MHKDGNNNYRNSHHNQQQSVNSLTPINSHQNSNINNRRTNSSHDLRNSNEYKSHNNNYNHHVRRDRNRAYDQGHFHNKRNYPDNQETTNTLNNIPNRGGSGYTINPAGGGGGSNHPHHRNDGGGNNDFHHFSPNNNNNYQRSNNNVNNHVNKLQDTDNKNMYQARPSPKRRQQEVDRQQSAKQEQNIAPSSQRRPYMNKNSNSSPQRKFQSSHTRHQQVQPYSADSNYKKSNTTPISAATLAFLKKSIDLSFVSDNFVEPKNSNVLAILDDEIDSDIEHQDTIAAFQSAVMNAYNCRIQDYFETPDSERKNNNSISSDNNYCGDFQLNFHITDTLWKKLIKIKDPHLKSFFFHFGGLFEGKKGMKEVMPK